MTGSYRANNLISQYLAKQNLTCKGSSNRLNEIYNGNFLKIVEMIEKFNHVMVEHVWRIQKTPDNMP
jgi:hypothetical protein